MTGLGMTGVGVASGRTAVGTEALRAALDWQPTAPVGSTDAEEVSKRIAAFKRSAGLRYVDPVAERGIRALYGAARHAELSPDWIQKRAERIAILMATRTGPSATREQLYKSLESREGKSVSATVFSNCGYNITSSVMAQSLGVRGAVLMIAASQDWGASLLGLASRMLRRNRADLVFAGYADDQYATVLCIEPWERAMERAPLRALHFSEARAAAEPGGLTFLVSLDPPHLTDEALQGAPGLPVAPVRWNNSMQVPGRREGSGGDWLLWGLAWLGMVYSGAGAPAPGAVTAQAGSGGLLVHDSRYPRGHAPFQDAAPAPPTEGNA